MLNALFFRPGQIIEHILTNSLVFCVQIHYNSVQEGDYARDYAERRETPAGNCGISPEMLHESTGIQWKGEMIHGSDSTADCGRDRRVQRNR